MSKRGKRIDDNTVFQRVGFGGPMRRAGFRPFIFLPPMSNLKIERNAKTLRELTLDKLRGAIVQGYFRPGERLVERTLCDELGVSRTVVREVLRHLETEGLVEIAVGHGPIVARLDPALIGEIYELGGLLEYVRTIFDIISIIDISGARAKLSCRIWAKLKCRSSRVSAHAAGGLNCRSASGPT